MDNRPCRPPGQGRSGSLVRRHGRGFPADRQPLRRGARRLGDGRVRRIRPRLRGGALARRGAGHRPACDPTGRLRSALDGRGGAPRGGLRRRRHRHQHGVPGQARDRRLCRLGADARDRPRRPHHRNDRRGGALPGHPQDAARLGPFLPERSGAGAAGARRRGCRRDGAWPHAPAILQRRRRLGRHPACERERRRRDARRRQRRCHDVRPMPAAVSTPPTRRR